MEGESKLSSTRSRSKANSSRCGGEIRKYKDVRCFRLVLCYLENDIFLLHLDPGMLSARKIQEGLALRVDVASSSSLASFHFSPFFLRESLRSLYLFPNEFDRSETEI